MVRGDKGEFRGDRKNVAKRPGLEEIKGYVCVEFEESLEGDEALLELLVGVPVGFAFETCFGPAIEKVLHRVNSASDTIICDVNDVVEKKMR